jgi:hypothetical protein
MNKLIWPLLGALAVLFGAARDGPDRTRPASAEQHHAAERTYWRRQTWIGIGALCVSIIAVIVAGFAFWAAQGQLSAMRGEQRPWIKVEPAEIGDFLTYAGLDGPEASLRVSFKLTNIGKNPAVGIRFLAWGFAGPFGGFPTHTTRNDVDAEQRRRCDTVRRVPLGDAARGATILPGDDLLDIQLNPPLGGASLLRVLIPVRLRAPHRKDTLGLSSSMYTDVWTTLPQMPPMITISRGLFTRGFISLKGQTVGSLLGISWKSRPLALI